MSTSPEDAPSEASAAAAQAYEPLACVSCRSRKLKCDRRKPVCTRCEKAGGECVYPESRRKPAFKRRNVRELEERLSQVEGLLRSVGKQRAGPASLPNAAWTEESSPADVGGENATSNFLGLLQSGRPDGAVPYSPLSPTESSPKEDGWFPGELIGLGQFESLPPFDMIEDLHRIFFETQGLTMPVVYRDNYLRSFHSPPHMRPPMSLQYAVWTTASNGHPKYGRYHDALYRRARHYLEAEELKGHGEHFITLGHAQAWVLVSTDEARCLHFTRASMSSARCIRLTGMMGLHRLDDTTDEELPMAPMIAPPKTWAEIEERRRLFWGAFAIDSYASISAGWPNLIDVNQVTTHLPASEEAFTRGVEEKSCTLQDVFKGAAYSTFGGNVVICHVFNQLMKHAHRPMPEDHPDDPEYGTFWKRHRELDNMLSSAFMFLPERFRLPRNIRDSVAVQLNLNLHAAVICLHNTACEKADKFKLPRIKQTSRTRALNSAQEIVDIIKLTSHMREEYKSPLMALSLYFAASVYVAQAKEKPEECESANLELLAKSMDSMGRRHTLTRAYLNQLLLDLERNGISGLIDFVPTISELKPCCHGIPIVARGPVSRHSKVQPPLPGRLPLWAPQGVVAANTPSTIPYASFVTHIAPEQEDISGPASKRMRISTGSTDPRMSETAKHVRADIPSSTPWAPGRAGPNSIDGVPATALFGYPGGWSYAAKYMAASTTATTTLPHRTGSPAMGASSATPGSFRSPGQLHIPMSGDHTQTTFTQPIAGPSSTTTATATLGSTSATSDFLPNIDNRSNDNTNDSEVPDLDIFQDLGEWGVTDPESFYAMLAEIARGNNTGTDDYGTSQSQDSNNPMDPWGGAAAGGSGGSAWDTGEGGSRTG
ncbi:Citrinin biosynthesis transcriptional activator ctnR [Madurella fahalii]|uniref:Citrinin biosynthesis transcriptional activator ctnR n=1 Tax=Madurella fahalii TaxID=1157608 RepID=A0ABQ0GQU8_9PEZI